jgi:hypothetical protein
MLRVNLGTKVGEQTFVFSFLIVSIYMVAQQFIGPNTI